MKEKEYNVVVQEIIHHDIPVRARSAEEAREKALDRWYYEKPSWDYESVDERIIQVM